MKPAIADFACRKFTSLAGHARRFRMSDQPITVGATGGITKNDLYVNKVAADPALTPPPTAAFVLASFSALFASIYCVTNQMTSVRVDVGAAFFEWERAIPFVDWTIIPYGSILAFFAASFFL